MSTLDAIGAHLQALEYEVSYPLPGLVFANHKQAANFTIREDINSIHLVSFFRISPQWKHKEEILLERLNEFNSRSAVCSCYVDTDNNVVVRASIPDDYEKNSFQFFLVQLTRDISLLADENIRIGDFFK